VTSTRLVAPGVTAASGVEAVTWSVRGAGSTASRRAPRPSAGRVPAAAMRNLVAIIGFALAGYDFWRQWQA
jgi:hypothetical protein